MGCGGIGILGHAGRPCCYCPEIFGAPCNVMALSEDTTWSLDVSGLHSTGPGAVCMGGANGLWTLDWYTTLSPSGLCESWEFRTAGFAVGIGWRLVIVDRHAATPAVLEARNMGVALIWRWEWSIGNCALVEVPGCPATGSEAFTLTMNP